MEAGNRPTEPAKPAPKTEGERNAQALENVQLSENWTSPGHRETTYYTKSAKSAKTSSKARGKTNSSNARAKKLPQMKQGLNTITARRDNSTTQIKRKLIKAGTQTRINAKT